MAIIFPFKPNWSSPVTKTLNYKTDIRVTRDKTEERDARRSQPRTSLEFTANPVRGDVAKLSALLFKDIQGEFVMPEFTVIAKATVDRVAGFDSFIMDDPVPFWVAAGLWVVVTTSTGLEAFLVASVAAGTVTITGTLAGDMTAGAKVYPGLVGRLDQASKVSLITSRASGFPVGFDVDPGARNYRAQGVPFYDGAITGITRRVTAAIGGSTTYYTLAQLGLTAEMVDTGRVSFSEAVHAKFTDSSGGVMNGYVSAHVACYADNGAGAHATTALPGGTFDSSVTTTTGETTQTVAIKLLPGTRHVGLKPQVISTIPFYTLATYSVTNTISWLPESDSIQSYFKETPIFVLKPNWSTAVSLTAMGGLEKVDYDNGVVENYSYLNWNAISTQAVFMRRDQAEIDRLVQLFNDLRGQQGEFYAPTWLDDFDLSLGAAQGAYTLTTPGLTVFQAYADSEFHKAAIIFWRDGTFQINPVVSIAGAGLNSLTTFQNPWTKALNSTNAILACWFLRSRLMIDTLTLEYQTDSKVTTQLTYKIVKELT